MGDSPSGANVRFAVRYSRKMKFIRRPLTSITSPSLSFLGPVMACR